ncbi:phage protein [Escherichia coli]|nr:phage protein [Escherichia coli]
MWMVATFIVVAGCFVRLVGEGKDLVGVLFGSIFLWVIIGVMPVAVAKMAWRFVS